LTVWILINEANLTRISNIVSNPSFKCYLQMNQITYKDIEITNLFNRFDINKDGLIDIWEFKTFLTPKNFSKLTPPEIFEQENEEISKPNSRNSLNNSHGLSSSNINSFQTLTMSERIEINKDLCSIDKNPNFLPSFKNIRNCNLEEEMFCNYLKDLIIRYKKIDEIRGRLAKRYDFNLTDIYNIFINNKKINRGLRKEEFKNALNELSIYPTENELTLLFKRFCGKTYAIE
jgi:hypothetical protein